jgi:hypothetical protein
MNAAKAPPDSVYFYTFHKCASSLFSGYVLKNVDGLENVNYAREIYSGDRPVDISFEKRGKIYGPIRLSADKQSPVYHSLVARTARRRFVWGKRAVFMIRDPRDVLVSQYYSFGFSHGLSKSKPIRERQLELRSEIQRMSLDEYAIKNAEEVRSNFRRLRVLYRWSGRGVIIRYEDMINDWQRFSSGLTSNLAISAETLDEIYRRSRPLETENRHAHRRSGRTGTFQEKLETSTVLKLNRVLKPVLDYFGYQS